MASLISGVYLMTGSVKKKLHPLPARLFSQILPPLSSTSILHKASPMPRPPV
jgi:hypothetical protein